MVGRASSWIHTRTRASLFEIIFYFCSFLILSLLFSSPESSRWTWPWPSLHSAIWHETVGDEERRARNRRRNESLPSSCCCCCWFHRLLHHQATCRRLSKGKPHYVMTWRVTREGETIHPTYGHFLLLLERRVQLFDVKCEKRWKQCSRNKNRLQTDAVSCHLIRVVTVKEEGRKETMKGESTTTTTTVIRITSSILLLISSALTVSMWSPPPCRPPASSQRSQCAWRRLSRPPPVHYTIFGFLLCSNFFYLHSMSPKRTASRRRRPLTCLISIIIYYPMTIIDYCFQVQQGAQSVLHPRPPIRLMVAWCSHGSPDDVRLLLIF